MSQHHNIQIRVQRVTVTQVPARGMAAASREREVTDVLNLAVTADFADDAYTKAIRILELERDMGGPGSDSLLKLGKPDRAPEA